MSRARRILLGLWIGLVLGGGAAALAMAGLPHLSRELVFWLVACVAGELLWVRLAAGQATISMASCFNVAAVLVLAPGEAMVAAAVATLVAELAFMRKPPLRAFFNAGQTMLAVGLAGWLFAASGGRAASLIDQVSHLRLVPILVAVAAYYVVNRGTVVVVVALAESISLGASWHRNFGSTYDPLAYGGTASLGALLATQWGTLGMIGTVFIALPLVLACDSYRRFTRDSSAPAAEPPASERKAA